MAAEDAAMEAEGEEEEAPEGARWARDSSDVVWCQSAAGLSQAVEDGMLKVEVGAVEAGDVEALLQAVAQVAPRIQGLSLTGCGLDDAAISRLGDALSASGIQQIGVSNNAGVGAAAWAQLWGKLPATVVKWDLGDNGLPDEVLPSLVAAMGKGRVEELFLDGNELVDIAPLLQVVRESSDLTELDIGDNNVQDQHVVALAQLLPNSNLSTLVLGRNPVTDASATILAYALPSSKVEILHLDSTQITDRTLWTLAEVLPDTRLEELHVDQTQVKDAGVLQLCQALPSSHVKLLDVSDNGLSESTISAIEAALPSDVAME